MTVNEINNILGKQVRDDKAPSIQYIIFNRDNIIHSSQQGYANILNKKNATEETTYNAYSVTKTFTALAILQLAEQRKINIEYPVKNYLPEFPYSPDITIKQLLTHSAGIPNPIPLSWIHLAEEHGGFDRNSFFKNIFHKHPNTRSKPNQKFSYSNLGYVLLGQLIEKITGTGYENYITENILNRLPVNQSDIGFTITDINKHAKGYHKRNSFSYFILGFFINKKKYFDTTEGVWKSFKTNYVNGASYGGLIGTPNTFVTYAQQLLKHGSVLISDEYKKLLFTENFTVSRKPTGMCLAWFKGHLNGTEYFAHAGGGGGYYCEVRIYPNKGIGSVIMFNRTGMSDERFLNKLDKYFIYRQNK